MSFFSVKDFTTGLAAKIRSVLVNTDENLPAHIIQDSAGNEIFGTKTDAKDSHTDATALSFMQVFKQISASVQAPPTNAFTATATFTPAASSHVAPACNGAAQQFSFSPVPTSGALVMITDAEFEIDGATAEATAWRLYLYNVTPPSALSDTTTFDVPSGDRASYLGYIDLGTAVDLGSTQWVEAHGINKVVKLSGTTVFGYLVNLTTLTPANVSHIGKLYGVPV